MSKAHVGTLSKLVAENQVERVTRSFVQAISGSFVVDGGTPTRDEVTRRFDICLRLFCELYADLKWSVPKILDFIPRYLRCELDGIRYNPNNENGAWSVEDPTPPVLFDPAGSIISLR